MRYEPEFRRMVCAAFAISLGVAFGADLINGAFRLVLILGRAM